MPLTLLAATRIIFGWSPQRLGSAPIGIYLPKPPYIWQDAARTTAAVATNPVGGLDTWPGGASATLTAAGASRPTSAITAGIYNLTLDSIAQAMARTGLSYGTAGLTFCVGASLSANGNFPMLLTGTSGECELRCNAATRQPEFVFKAAAATSPTALTVGTMYIITGRYSPVGGSFGTIDLWVNSVQKASALLLEAFAAQTSLNLGQRAGGSLFWPGSVAAAVAVNAAVNDQTRRRLERWTARQCGLAI